MSRREQIVNGFGAGDIFDIDCILALADEVDDLRGKLDDVRQNIGCARGQRSTQYCAEAAQRDEVIGKLLAMLKPDPKVPCDCIGEIGPQCYCMNQGDAMRAESWWTEKCLYARACEIAGRVE